MSKWREVSPGVFVGAPHGNLGRRVSAAVKAKQRAAAKLMWARRRMANAEFRKVVGEYCDILAKREWKGE